MGLGLPVDEKRPGRRTLAPGAIVHRTSLYRGV